MRRRSIPSVMSEDSAEPRVTPFELLGGAPAVRALVERFYDEMGEHEPELARLHVCDANGRVVVAVAVAPQHHVSLRHARLSRNRARRGLPHAVACACACACGPGPGPRTGCRAMNIVCFISCESIHNPYPPFDHL